MNPRLLATLFALTCLCGAEARADTFGGFSRDERLYLRGNDQICKPFAAGKTVSGFPVCERAAPDRIAGLGFRKGVLQSAATARYAVKIRGTAICVVDARTGTKAAGWASLDAISRIAAVRSSQNGRLLAVEFESRVAGRLVAEVVVFAMPVSGDGAAAAADPPDRPKPPDRAGGTGVAAADLSDADQKEVAAHIEKAWRLVKKRAYKKAAARFRKALARDEDNPEARYGLAVSLIRKKDKAGAISELEKLASSNHPEAVVWRVEARFDKAFRKVLGDSAFRRAVGLDVTGAKAGTAYERLVGEGGHWEQSSVMCDRARVNLKLQRRPRKFKMRIRTRCRGLDETTRLDGQWRAKGASSLELTFPNMDGPDEVMKCGLAVCSDGSGEDCLTCGAGTDMEMQFQVVRR